MAKTFANGARPPVQTTRVAGEKKRFPVGVLVVAEEPKDESVSIHRHLGRGEKKTNAVSRTEAAIVKEPSLANLMALTPFTSVGAFKGRLRVSLLPAHGPGASARHGADPPPGPASSGAT